MAGIRLEFAQFGDFDSFDIHRSTSSMTDINNLPIPITTDLKSMFYVDDNVTQGVTYYYRVVVWRDGNKAVSDEVIVIAQQGDQYWNYVSSLLHFNGANNSTSFIDQKSNTWSRVGTPIISTEQSKFGGASGRFSKNNYISTSNMTGFLFGATEDFTIEAWVYIPLNATVYQNLIPIICVGYQDISSAGGGWNLCISDTSTARIGLQHCKTNFTTQNADFSIDSSLTRNTWHHIEFGRSGTTTYGFFNGSLVGTTTDQNNVAFTSPNFSNVSIASGNNRSSMNYWHFDGFIDELRITKGVCRHTASFTPQTSEYPNGA